MSRVLSLWIMVGTILLSSVVHCEEEYSKEVLDYMEAVARHGITAQLLYNKMALEFFGVPQKQNHRQNSQEVQMKTNTSMEHVMEMMASMEEVSACVHALDYEVSHVKTGYFNKEEAMSSVPNQLISDESAGWKTNTEIYLNASEIAAEGIIYGTRGGITAVSLPSLLETKISDDYVINQVAFDRSSRKVYWIDGKAHSIKRANLDGTDVEILLQVDSQALAVDSITGNIYYQNATSDDIRVCSRSGERCSVLAKYQNSVNNVVVHPSKSLMFWIRDVYTVVRANMDGTNLEVLLSRRVYRFAIDEVSDRLYWIALDQKNVRSCDLNGKDERVVLDPTRFVRSAIAVYGDGAYFGRYLFHGHGAINKNGLNPGIVASTTFYIQYMAVYAREAYFRTNPCTTASAPCSHLCVLKQESFACLCPEGERLDEDGVTCV